MAQSATVAVSPTSGFTYRLTHLFRMSFSHTLTSPPTAGKESVSSLRIDVQQVRGIAVLAVIINHLQSAILPGGYLGVDVFFVVSGYVITRSLMNQSENTQTARGFLKAFWIRRTFRLWPMLFTTVVITSTLILLLGIDFPGTLLTGLTSLFAVSNYRLIQGRLDYFALNVESDWFMHTWSLAAEEQIYLALSLMTACTISLSRRFRYSVRRVLTVSISALSAASLGLALVPATSELIRFYSSHKRFYQVGFGAILALTDERLRKCQPLHSLMSRYVALLSLAGILLVFLTDVSAGRLSSLITSLLTVIALAASTNSQQQHGYVRFRVLTAIGDRSYSLYLLHWPVQLLVFTYFESLIIRATLSIALTMLLGWISYSAIEGRTRHRWMGMKRRTAGLVPCVALFLSALILAVILVVSSRSSTLALVDEDGARCAAGESETWLVGDSHMDVTIPVIAELTNGDCRRFGDYGPILSFQEVSESSSGQRSIAAVLGEPADLITAIEVAAVKPRVLYVIHFLTAFLSDPQTAPSSADFVSTEWRDSSGRKITREEFGLGIRQILVRVSEAVATSGGVVIVTSPPPDFDWLRRPIEDLSKCNRNFVVDLECRTLRTPAVISLSAHEKRRAEVTELLNALESVAPNLAHLPLDQPFCNIDTCSNFHDGLPAYVDDDHVSSLGRDLIKPLISEKTNEIAPNTLMDLECRRNTSVFACQILVTGGRSTGYYRTPEFITPRPTVPPLVAKSHIDEAGNRFCVELFQTGQVAYQPGRC
ncbi:MAG: acyltransferase family protein [Actinomycetota bacterium]